MKLFVQLPEDDARTMSEIPVDNLHLMIELGNFRYRITDNGGDAILVRESTIGRLCITPESANAVEIAGRV